MEQWLRDHWPEGVVVATLALLRWLGVREVNRVDAQIENHEQRLSDLETDRVTQANVEELRASLTATITSSSERIEKRVDRILDHLLERAK